MQFEVLLTFLLAACGKKVRTHPSLPILKVAVTGWLSAGNSLEQQYQCLPNALLKFKLLVLCLLFQTHFRANSDLSKRSAAETSPVLPHVNMNMLL